MMQSILRFFTSLRVVVICLALLMVLVVLGTVHQVEFGLWAAQQRFFYSWVVLLFGFVPIPGAQLVMWVLFLCLTVSLVTRFRLGWRQAGLISIHVGLMLMLAGGWVTHRFGEESFLTLLEGEGSNVSADYRHWELSVSRGSGSVREVTGVNTAGLEEGTAFSVEGFDLPVTVVAYYSNSEAFTGPVPAQEPDFRNASGIVRLEETARNRDPERDLPGLIIDVDIGSDQPDRILLFGGDTAEAQIDRNGETLFLSLRRIRYPLPVFVTLRDFRKTVHPGTNTPKSFSSLADVRMQDVERQVVIEMNRPFRYQGFTFFQASYAEMAGGLESSTFAVTQNYGRLIPYIATALTVFGLVLHFVVEMVQRGRLMARGRKG